MFATIRSGDHEFLNKKFSRDAKFANLFHFPVLEEIFVGIKFRPLFPLFNANVTTFSVEH